MLRELATLPGKMVFAIFKEKSHDNTSIKIP
jgi:hypothetical protein